MTDIKKYCDELSKGMQEKLFFLDHVEPDALLDYGCADGQVIEAITSETGIVCYGYDQNSKILPNERFVTSNLDYALSYINMHKDMGDTTALLLSSILHEAYSVECGDEILRIAQDFDYIIIRDMFMSNADKKKGVDNDVINQALDHVNLRLVNHFVREVSPLLSLKGFIHFLMKHRFANNWEHEIKEDYFSLTDEIVDQWCDLGTIIHKERYPLPYYQEVFKSRYEYELTTPTHINLIIEL